jgi:hypothetical protein
MSSAINHDTQFPAPPDSTHVVRPFQSHQRRPHPTATPPAFCVAAAPPLPPRLPTPHPYNVRTTRRGEVCNWRWVSRTWQRRPHAGGERTRRGGRPYHAGGRRAPPHPTLTPRREEAATRSRHADLPGLDPAARSDLDEEVTADEEDRREEEAATCLRRASLNSLYSLPHRHALSAGGRRRDEGGRKASLCRYARLAPSLACCRRQRGKPRALGAGSSAPQPRRYGKTEGSVVDFFFDRGRTSRWTEAMQRINCVGLLFFEAQLDSFNFWVTIYGQAIILKKIWTGHPGD